MSKKLIILGGNPETGVLVDVANSSSVNSQTPRMVIQIHTRTGARKIDVFILVYKK